MNEHKKKQEGKNEWTLSCGNNVYNALEKNVKVSENRKKKRKQVKKMKFIPKRCSIRIKNITYYKRKKYILIFLSIC